MPESTIRSTTEWMARLGPFASPRPRSLRNAPFSTCTGACHARVLALAGHIAHTTLRVTQRRIADAAVVTHATPYTQPDGATAHFFWACPNVDRGGSISLPLPVATLPARMRGVIWLTASGGADLLKGDPNIYEDTLSESTSPLPPPLQGCATDPCRHLIDTQSTRNRHCTCPAPRTLSRTINSGHPRFKAPSGASSTV